MSRAHAICESCRAVVDEHLACGCDAPRLAALDALRRRPREPLIAPQRGDDGGVYWAGRESSRHRHRAELRRELRAGRAVSGRVEDGPLWPVPILGGRGVAAAVLLWRQQFAHGGVRVLYRADGFGFHVRLQSGERVQVPAGPIRLEGQAIEVDRPAEVLDYVAELTELPTEWFKYKRSLVLAIAPGDPVVIRGPLARHGSDLSVLGVPTVSRVSPDAELPAGIPWVPSSSAGSSAAAASAGRFATWPRRTWVCAACRGAFGPGDECACGEAGVRADCGDIAEMGSATPALRDRARDRREAQLHRFRGRPPWEKIAPVAAAGAGVTAAAVLLGAPFIYAGLFLGSFLANRVVAQRRRRAILGAGVHMLEAPEQARSGVVRAGDLADSLVSGEPCVACAVELRVAVGETEQDVLLRCSVTVGFTVETDAGETVDVPAGPLEIIGPAARRGGRHDDLLDWLFPGMAAGAPDNPFAGTSAYEVIVRDGDRVRLRADARTVPDPSAGAGLYRDGVATVTRTSSLPLIELVA